MLLGNAGVNIATFNLGRKAQGGEAICLVSIDEPPPQDVLEALSMLPQVKHAKPLAF
jgi:D-3-phosphoglycerate dehydrogenase